MIGAVLVLASSAAEAGLPKPINMLTISRRWDPSRRAASMRSHKYNRPGWGAQWKLLFRSTAYQGHHYIRTY
jgi:hypothetical protein